MRKSGRERLVEVRDRATGLLDSAARRLVRMDIKSSLGMTSSGTMLVPKSMGYFRVAMSPPQQTPPSNSPRAGNSPIGSPALATTWSALLRTSMESKSLGTTSALRADSRRSLLTVPPPMTPGALMSRPQVEDRDRPRSMRLSCSSLVLLMCSATCQPSSAPQMAASIP